MSTEQPEAPQWAVVELMGHIRLAGRLTEEERFGTKMGRLDIPVQGGCSGVSATFCPGFITQYFGGGSVYRITIVTEDVARHVAKQSDPAPVSAYEFPKQLASASRHDDDDRDY